VKVCNFACPGQLATDIFYLENLEDINKINAEVAFHDDLGELRLPIVCDEADVLLDHDSVGAVTKHTVYSVDESDSNFVAILEHEADLTGQFPSLID
jgi:hypothetical protein